MREEHTTRSEHQQPSPTWDTSIGHTLDSASTLEDTPRAPRGGVSDLVGITGGPGAAHREPTYWFG